MDQNKPKADGSNLGDTINEFIQRNRKTIFIITGIIVVAFLGAVVFFTVKSNLDKNSFVAAEELIKKTNELKPSINDENSSDDDVNALLEELETFASKSNGLSGSKVWSLAGEIYALQKNWEKAEVAYINSAHLGRKTYLGPISLFNAAAAAEEQGSYEQAIDLLQQCVSHKIEFPAAPRAQFAIGRLHEKLRNFSEATEAYREILIKWPNMNEWNNLAQNRIIAIEANKL